MQMNEIIRHRAEATEVFVFNSKSLLSSMLPFPKMMTRKIRSKNKFKMILIILRNNMRIRKIKLKEVSKK